MEVMPHVRSSVGSPINGEYYTAAFPSGVTCAVIKGDITKLKCDAIVNAANGELDHCGGLAHAIVRAGKGYISSSTKYFEHRICTLTPNFGVPPIYPSLS
mgnify:FL=1